MFDNSREQISMQMGELSVKKLPWECFVSFFDNSQVDEKECAYYSILILWYLLF